MTVPQNIDADVETVRIDADIEGNAAGRAAFADALTGGDGVGYVVLRDARDRWTSPDKLRRQIDWLGDNPHASACFHDVDVVVEDDGGGAPTKPRRLSAPGRHEHYRVEDIWVQSAFIALSSLVMRADAIESIPDWFHSRIVSPAFALPFLLAREGTLGYLPEVLAVGASASCLPPRHEEAEIHERRLVNAQLDFRYESYLGRFIATRGLTLARTCLAADRVPAARRHFATAWSHLPIATTLLAGTLPLRLLLAGRRRR